MVGTNFSNLDINLIPLLGRLQQFINRSSKEGLSTQDMRTVTMLAYILSLLSGNFDFDEIRAEYSG